MVDKANKANKVRIIAGSLKNRKVSILGNSKIRPSTDRGRETLFNWLQTKINNSKCLDLFSGSGILSIESISRGASFCYINDLDNKTIKHISQSLIDFNIDTNKYKTSNKNTLNLLKKSPTDIGLEYNNFFDIVFLDPPFNQNKLKISIELIINNNWLADNGLIYFECEKQLDILKIITNINSELNISLDIINTKTYGGVCFGLITL